MQPSKPFVDIHCHLIPGIDDGSQSWSESLAVARMAVADGIGSIREFGDVYGIDNQMAAKLFKNPAYFNVPFSGAEFAETTPTRRYSEPRRRRGPTTVDDFLSGLLGN